MKKITVTDKNGKQIVVEVEVEESLESAIGLPVLGTKEPKLTVTNVAEKECRKHDSTK